jgi:preprotein translocase subunit SecG
MLSVVVGIHILVCVSLVIVILLQQGKGADVGAVFGGSSQTVFGASGAGSALTKATAALGAIFFATSIFLAYASTRRVSGSIFQGSSRRSIMPVAPASKKAPPAGNAGSGTPAPVSH